MFKDFLVFLIFFSPLDKYILFQSFLTDIFQIFTGFLLVLHPATSGRARTVSNAGSRLWAAVLCRSACSQPAGGVVFFP